MSTKCTLVIEFDTKCALVIEFDMQPLQVGRL